MTITRLSSPAPFADAAGTPEPEQLPAPGVAEPLPERPLEPPVPLPGSPPQPEPPVLPPTTDDEP